MRWRMVVVSAASTLILAAGMLSPAVAGGVPDRLSAPAMGTIRNQNDHAAGRAASSQLFFRYIVDDDAAADDFWVASRVRIRQVEVTGRYGTLPLLSAFQ